MASVLEAKLAKRTLTQGNWYSCIAPRASKEPWGGSYALAMPVVPTLNTSRNGASTLLGSRCWISGGEAVQWLWSPCTVPLLLLLATCQRWGSPRVLESLYTLVATFGQPSADGQKKWQQRCPESNLNLHLIGTLLSLACPQHDHDATTRVGPNIMVWVGPWVTMSQHWQLGYLLPLKEEQNDCPIEYLCKVGAITLLSFRKGNS